LGRGASSGPAGATVSALGLGCAALATAGDPDAVVKAALDAGMDFFDTSDLYGVGQSETVLGRALSGIGRDHFTVATKFGSMPGKADGVGDGPRTVNNDPRYIPQACDASLRRLGVDVIDLYYMHRRDPAVPIEESVGAMARLVEAGKVRFLGLSEVSAATLRAANAVHPISALQSEYSLWMREREADVLPVCRDLGIAFVPFSPLGRAFLTGTLDVETLSPRDFRRSLPRFQGEAIARNQRLVDALRDFAETLGPKPGQIALAWLIAKGTAGAPVVPIPGTRRPEFVRENAAAADVRLSAEQIAELDALFVPEAVSGARYPEDEEARVGT
jgi:aryl-alcohol dehydrogenase-like predicted oxidoreductase